MTDTQGVSTSTRRVLWAATVRTKSLADRLHAAEVGRFAATSFFPIDLAGWIDAGISLHDVRTQLEAAQLSVVAIDPFTQWVPRWQAPAGYPAGYLDFVRFTADDVLRMAAAVGAQAINCVEPFGVDYERAELVDALGSFAERARREGLRVTLEFMPISGIRSLADGWAIVEPLPATVVGLTFDTWHYFRSTVDDALLRSIPGDRVFEVQLADARMALAAPTLTDDLLHHRLLPGEGDFDLTTAVASLRAIGGYRSVGPELFSDRFDAMSAAVAGRTSGDNLDRWT
jgi:sugar phosphate isomerase/epimerase